MGGAVSLQSESGEGPFAGGTGTADDPYQIATANDLREFAKLVNNKGETTANAVLTADIDLSSVCSKEKGNWTPIGNEEHLYTGTFDGNGHTISGLYINSSSADFQGLFGCLDQGGTVQDLSVSGSVSGNRSVGGVVGLNRGNVENCYNIVEVSGNQVGGVVGYNGGTVENCHNTGTVSDPDSGTGNRVGGVVGWNISSGNVKNCYNTGKVTGSSSVGGVVGYNGGSVTNCYNTDKVTGSGDRSNVGGVVGWNISSVENCYNTGKVIGSSVGGVVGDNYGSVTNCYFLQGTAEKGIGNKEDAEGAAAVNDLNDQKQFKGWDFADTWRISQSLNRPVLQANAEDNALSGTGKQEDPYKIYRAIDLKNFRDLVNDGSEKSAHAKLMNNIDLSSVCSKEKGNWTPIGSDSKPYTGTFNGDGHTISGLYIDSRVDYQGLFGYLSTDGDNTGTVQNLSVSGTVSGKMYVGGVVGYNGGSVENCYNTGAVNSTYDYVGGVVGYNSGPVKNCYNTGNISVSIIGGISGGVVGGNGGTVENCYNTGNISGNRSGGVVGYNNGDSVTNCYNTGNVSGGSKGGVVGYNDGDSVANCYYLQQNGVPAQGIGGGSGTSNNVEARTDDAFQSGEVAYLLGEAWGQNLMNEPKDNYPQLRAFDADTPQVYKVAFMNGEEYHAEYANSGMTVGSPTTNPTKEGYTFNGWFTETSGGSQWNFSTAVTKNMTLYAQWTAVEEPDPEPEEPPYTGKYSYEVFTSVGDNGTISVDRYATEGEKVTIDVTPDQAYKLDDLTVTAHGKDVELTANSDGTYTFTMPSADVKITATFAEDPDWTEPEEPATDVSDLFSDIARDAWYKDAVQYAYDNGLMTGVSATEFAPEQTTTRAMIVSILARLENVTTAEAAGFADVNDEWYATAVNWAANVGVVNGYEDNTFRPNTAITREQLAAILMNYAACIGQDVSARASLDNYTDQPSTWAQEAMQWAVAEKLISGVTADTLQPQGAATRAQVAAILQRFLSE